MKQITFDEISKIRLISQKIVASKFKTAHEIVSWMGAIQAQNHSMAKWAVGVRIPGSTDELIESSFNRGEILRSHLMRPTWHYVSPENIRWMLELTAPQIKTLLRSRNKELELSEALLTKSNRIIERSFKAGGSLTREELSKEFDIAGIRTDGNRLSHLLLSAELDGIICSGPYISGRETYSLLHERVRAKKVLTRDESLAELAKLYFNSHCPATLQDFSWWSGLSRKDATHAMGSVRHNFLTKILNSAEYLFPKTFSGGGHDETSVHLLPAYDEFLISYKDRSASLAMTDDKKAVSNNGIFYPVIIVDGKVTGVWKRSVKNSKAIIELQLFHPLNKANNDLLEEKASAVGEFLKKETEIRYKT